MQLNKMRILGLGILIGVIISSLAYSQDRFHAPSTAGGNISITTTSPERGITRVQFTDPQISQETVTVDGGQYTDLWIEGERTTVEPGLPSVPVVSRLIGIPDRGNVELRILSAEYTELPGMQLYPFQTMEEPTESGTPFRWNREFYNQDTWYPEEIAVIGDPAVFRDVRLVSVAISPIQVNPATGTVRVYHNIDIQVESVAGAGTNEKTRTFSQPSSLFLPLYRDLLNFEYLELDEEPSLPGQYLIICADNAVPIGFAEELADWRQRQGIPTRIATRTETGNNYYQINYYIQNAYNTWDPPLEFVLLLGDDLGSPSSAFHVPSTGGYGASDHPYSQVAGSDILGDIAIGRLSASTQFEMDLLVTKTLRYDRDPFTTGPDWFTKAYLLAGTSMSISSNTNTMIYIQHHMYQEGFSEVILEEHNGHISSWNMRNQLDQGRSFFLWRGGFVGEMYASDLNGLDNGWMLPFVFVITCGTGDFASGTALSESWVRYGSINNGGGAIVCVGTATAGTNTRFNNIIAGGIGHGFFVTKVQEAGLALMEAKLQLYRSYYPQQSSSVDDFSRWNNLMGDPILRIWTASPQELIVTHPTEIPLGCNRVPVMVTDDQGDPVENTLVCLMKGDETWTRALTDETGYLEMPTYPETEGDLQITVSAYNRLTYYTDISVTQSDLWVAYSDADIDDDNQGGTSGNDDGVINPGEVVDLTITARNYGTATTATDVVGTLYGFDNSLAQVLVSESTFPDMAPESEAQSNSTFRVQISLGAEDQDLTPLLLVLTTDETEDTSMVPLTVVSGDAVIESHRFLLSGNRLDPGETENMVVAITNVGHRNISYVEGNLFTEDSLITFPDPTGLYGTITMGGNSTNTGDPFEITASATTIPGHPVTLGLALSGDGGFIDTAFFQIKVGSQTQTDPCGPDDYGYYCFDNTDTGYDIAPEFDWIEVDPNGTQLNIQDTYENDDENDIFTLPFNFQFYGKGYSEMTVCSNGWAAFGSQSSFVNFRNYAIPGAHGPDAMLAPFWDDLITGYSGGVYWEYIDSLGLCVIEWSGCSPLNTTYGETFQIILYDPEVYPTPTGDGMIKFQYLDVYNYIGPYDDNSYSTVGIEDHDQLVGLQISYWNSYSPGAANLSDGRAYLFTTSLEYGYGTLQGQVTDAETGDPLEGAFVSVGDGTYWDSTDANGDYTVDDIVVGTYDVVCSLEGYNNAESSVNISPESANNQNFDLDHPEFLMDITGIQETLSGGDTMSVIFHVENQGNGDLDYQISFDAAATVTGNSANGSSGIMYRTVGPVQKLSLTDDPWDQLLIFDVSTSANDQLIQGVAYADGNFWASGSGQGVGSPNYLYRFDRYGGYLSQVQQPTTSPYGFRDLTWDGEYLWGSDSQYLMAVDESGSAADSILGILNPNRAIAYDPGEDVFYTGNLTASIIVIDRTGSEVRRYADHDLTVFGLAWYKHDPDGCPLYLFCREGDDTFLRVEKLNPSDGEIQLVADLTGTTNDRAGGAMITPWYNSETWVFVGQIDGASADQIGVWEMAPNTGWVSCSPAFGTIASGVEQTFCVLLDAGEFPNGTFDLEVVFDHNASGGQDVLPVSMTVINSGVEDEGIPIPFQYSLGQNYPNPFNPTTSIPYSLREAGVAKLIVYNILGQKVATLVHQRREAGQHRAILDATKLASGVYFYRLEASTFTKTRKMVLLR